jgi:hypothetical protein
VVVELEILVQPLLLDQVVQVYQVVAEVEETLLLLLTMQLAEQVERDSSEAVEVQPSTLVHLQLV